MVQESKDDIFLEKVILFLVILVGAVLVFNQFQFAKLSSNIFLNSMSYLLILVLIGLVVWLFIKEERHGQHGQTAHHEKHITHEVHAAAHRARFEKAPFTFHEKLGYGIVAFVAVLILFNQFQISQVSASIGGTSSSVGSLVKSVSSGTLKLGPGKSGIVIGPQLNPDGRTTKLVEWSTISETPAPKSTGNPTQDAIAAVVPTGTPFYILEGPGSEKIKGATFDDPITSQKAWAGLLGSRRFGTENAIQLTPEEQQRWQRLTSVFTCDFCCGGPSSVTTINSCGCAHSYAWQGMAKFFIKYYPDYTDEQILGEMTKWKGLWYPQGMIQDYLVYTGQQSATILTHGGSVGIKQQFLQQAPSTQQQTHAQATPLDELPSMVGGC
ncbi:hypothetical protein HYV80_03905 [Candidatus Woesearchaeota archaeon]|nr:hypothetical protein [Candidatus Woesearchaeota archaeon]